jgi:hypothetical protein
MIYYPMELKPPTLEGILRGLRLSGASETEQRGGVVAAVEAGKLFPLEIEELRRIGWLDAPGHPEGQGTYYYHDTVVFRDRPNGLGWDRWRGQSWEPATGTLYPSFEEYLHMRRITEQEARARIPAAFADD